MQTLSLYIVFLYTGSENVDKEYGGLRGTRGGQFFLTLAQYAGGKEDNNFSHFGNKTLME